MIEPRLDAVAVELDLVDPAGPVGAAARRVASEGGTKSGGAPPRDFAFALLSGRLGFLRGFFARLGARRSAGARGAPFRPRRRRRRLVRAWPSWLPGLLPEVLAAFLHRRGSIARPACRRGPARSPRWSGRSPPRAAPPPAVRVARAARRLVVGLDQQPGLLPLIGRLACAPGASGPSASRRRARNRGGLSRSPCADRPAASSGRDPRS